MIFESKESADYREMELEWGDFSNVWKLGPYEGPVQSWLRRTFFPQDGAWKKCDPYAFARYVRTLQKKLAKAGMQAPDGIPF